MSIGNYAIVVQTSGIYPGFGGSDTYTYQINDVINTISIDPSLATYPLSSGLILQDNSFGQYQITIPSS